MQIHIRLSDNEDVVYAREELLISKKVNVKKLKEKIMKVWHIDVDNQLLYFNGTCIIYKSRTLGAYGMENGSTVVVKHRMLPMWHLYKNLITQVFRTKRYAEENSVQALRCLTEIAATEFFHVYPTFKLLTAKCHPRLMYWANGNLDAMVESAEIFFKEQHRSRGGQPGVGFYFAHRPRIDYNGGRNGVLVEVRMHGQQVPVKYYVKRHQRGCSMFTPTGTSPGIVQLLCYKIFERIGIGPKVQFILPLHGSEPTLDSFIVTEWRDDFLSMTDIADGHQFNINTLIELRLISMVFLAENLYGENCGQWLNSRGTAIVDVVADGISYQPRVLRRVMTLPDESVWDAGAVAMLMECTPQVYYRVVNNCLRRWKLHQILDTLMEDMSDLLDDVQKVRRIYHDVYGGQPFSVHDYVRLWVGGLNKALTDLSNALRHRG